MTKHDRLIQIGEISMKGFIHTAGQLVTRFSICQLFGRSKRCDNLLKQEIRIDSFVGHSTKKCLATGFKTSSHAMFCWRSNLQGTGIQGKSGKGTARNKTAVETITVAF